MINLPKSNLNEFENKYRILTSNLKSNQIISYQMPGAIYNLIYHFVTKTKNLPTKDLPEDRDSHLHFGKYMGSCRPSLNELS